MKLITGATSLFDKARIVKMALPALLVTIGMSSTLAHAAKFGVHVVDQDGSPIAGAAVCVGLQGNYKQFGALFTDANGNAVVEVPNMPLLVTVSKDRFTGMRVTEPARGYTLQKQVKLLEGVPGPRCRAGSVLAEQSIPNPPSINVREILMNDAMTSISPVVSGEPSQYRISSDPEFSGAKWKKYTNQIALAGSVSDEGKAYLQMRRFKGTSRAWLEARSEVVTIRLVN